MSLNRLASRKLSLSGSVCKVCVVGVGGGRVLKVNFVVGFGLGQYPALVLPTTLQCLIFSCLV